MTVEKRAEVEPARDPSMVTGSGRDIPEMREEVPAAEGPPPSTWPPPRPLPPQPFVT